jgi:hypothetical protein
MKGKKHNKRRIDSYKRETGTILSPPLASLSTLTMIDYHGVILPNLLWIEAVIDFYGDNHYIPVIYKFLDLLDDDNKETSKVLSGLILSFDYVPVSKRTTFVNNNLTVVRAAVVEPFANVIRMYPKCPMAWLISDYSGELPTFDLDSTASLLKKWTKNLVDREGTHSNIARTIVLPDI